MYLRNLIISITLCLCANDFVFAKHKWKGLVHKPVYLLHPWEGRVICFDCYAPAIGQQYEFECRFGYGYRTDCPPRDNPPDDPRNPYTEVLHTTVIATLYRATEVRGTSTSTLYGITSVATPYPYLHGRTLFAPRDWHVQVLFRHPFHPEEGVVCADASWHHRTFPEPEVRIQKTNLDLKACDRSLRLEYIDPPRDVTVIQTHTAVFKQDYKTIPVTTVYELDTPYLSWMTSTPTPTSTPTWTAARMEPDETEV